MFLLGHQWVDSRLGKYILACQGWFDWSWLRPLFVLLTPKLIGRIRRLDSQWQTSHVLLLVNWIDSQMFWKIQLTLISVWFDIINRTRYVWLCRPLNIIYHVHHSLVIQGPSQNHFFLSRHHSFPHDGLIFWFSGVDFFVFVKFY